MTARRVNGSRPGAGGAKPPARPGVGFPMCVMCCQRYKAAVLKEQDIKELVINPAITQTIMIVGGFPVPVPVCIHCLDVPESTESAKPQSPKLVDPYSGRPLS